MKAPETEQEKQSILASPKAVVDGKEVAIGFHTIPRSADVVGGQAFVAGRDATVHAAGNVHRRVAPDQDTDIQVSILPRRE